MATLPTPSHLLTTLLISLSSPPNTKPNNASNPNSNQATFTSNQAHDPPSNPLKALPPSYRALLTTLHVLLPTGVLLQALDLLDRGLVVRAVTEASSQSAATAPPGNRNERSEQESVYPPQSPRAHVHLGDSSHHPSGKVSTEDGVTPRTSEGRIARAGGNGCGKATLYQVRSSQQPKSRFRGGAGGELVYTVRTRAWNCSCAAFAFEAFPGGLSAECPWKSQGSDGEIEGDGDLGGETWDGSRLGGGDGSESGEERGWKFGGLGCDGREGGKVPVCKHLLACVLAERWGDVLGGYVKERFVGTEEMAGVGGEG